MSLIKKYYSQILFFIIFTIPIFLFGINDLEEYQLGTFSTLIFWESFENLFTFFYDFYGPGTKIPIGPGPIFHPLNFFLYDLKIYYTLFTLFHLYIQLEYTKKLFKLFKLSYNKHLLSIILIFSLPNIFFGLSEDWISCFFSYCILPVIFYYLVKIIKFQKFNSYIKFSLFFCFWIINGHLGHISTYIIFLTFYLILSIKNIDHIKKIINKTLFLCLILIAIGISEHIYFLLRELALFDGWKRFQGSYDIRNFIEIFYPNKNFLSSFAIYRLPGNPILIYFSLVVLVISLYNFLKVCLKVPIKEVIFKSTNLFFVRVNEDLNFKFSILFLIFFIFSLLPFLSVVPSVSAAYMARDVYLFLGIFIYFINYQKINFFLRTIINISLIFYTFLFFIINVYEKINLNENNFILNKNNNTDLINTFKNLNLSKNDYQRIYLSPNLFPEIWNGFEDDGIFAVTDFTKFNLAPFNGNFKHTSMKQFGDENNIMNGFIDSHYGLINNEFFLNIFKIKFLLIDKDELDLLENNNFKLIKNISTQNTDLYLFERKVDNYSINEKNLNILSNNLNNCKVRTIVSGTWINEDSKLDCLLRNEKLFNVSNHILNRVSNGVFSINNNDKYNYPILPFVYDLNWKSDNQNLINVSNFLLIVNTSRDEGIDTIISYEDNVRLILKILSFLSIFILILIIFVKRKIN